VISFLKKNFFTLKEELQSFSSQQRAFSLFAMLCCFFICCEYSAIRPVSNSLFISAFSTKWLPYAWLAVVPLNFALVSLYNSLLPKWGSYKFFCCLVTVVMGVNCIVALLVKQFPSLAFFFYIWKEVYVLMMFQLVWSIIHNNIKLDKAKYLYGIFFGVGGLGSVVGASFPGFFAIACGSETLIFLTLPLYLLLYYSQRNMQRFSTGEKITVQEGEKGGFLHGVRLIQKSRFLLFALFLVVVMQMISAIVDFQFNYFLEKAFTEKDLRTQFSARILGIVHTLNMILQFLGVYLLIRLIGYRRSHYILPSVLGVSASLLAAFPLFPIASAAFITCKALDFSLFGVIKEMLYVPLQPDEKYRAKAIIDVFAYRTSKAFASLLILSVTAFLPIQALSWVSIFLSALWLFTIGYGLREYEKLVA